MLRLSDGSFDNHTRDSEIEARGNEQNESNLGGYQRMCLSREMAIQVSDTTDCFLPEISTVGWHRSMLHAHDTASGSQWIYSRNTMAVEKPSSADITRCILICNRLLPAEISFMPDRHLILEVLATAL